MGSIIDYNELVSKYLLRVRNLRDVEAPVSSLEEARQASSATNAYFEIADDHYIRYQYMLEKYDIITSELLSDVMEHLITAYHITKLKLIKNAPILSLLFFDEERTTLIHFKKFGLPKPKDKMFISFIRSKQNITDIKFVSLVRDNPSEYSFDHAYDSYELPIQEFFQLFFSVDEYYAFEQMEREFSEKAKLYIGHTVIRTLAPNTLYSFKRHMISFVCSNEFASILDASNSRGNMDDVSSRVVAKQFFDKEYYKALVGNSLFAKSMITAEWMYDSMLSINKVDLTVVALGFFKALEQLLHDYIIMHSGEDKKIKRMHGNPELNNKPNKIYLNDTSIRKKWINTMMDSLISFLEDYPELFNEGISVDSRTHIIETLNEVKLMRNGFFHKDNIEDARIVEEARKLTYVAMYYLLGALRYRDEELNEFSIPIGPPNDYERLKEYMAYHVKSIYYIGNNEEPEYAAVSRVNAEAVYDQDGNIHVEKCVVDELIGFELSKFILSVEKIKNSEPYKQQRHYLDLSNNNLTIMEGEMIPVPEGMLLTGPVRTIYKNQKFLIKERDVVIDY